MRARVLAATTAAVLATTLSGCITVHGETAVVPAVAKAEAEKVLKRFQRVNNKATEAYDAKLNATVEAGSLGAIDQAGLRARKKVHPEGDEDHTPLRLTDARFLIPEQAGWPKFFVADAESNRSDGRWLLVFSRSGVEERWKATYLAVVAEEEIPEISVGEDGLAEAVPPGKQAGLTVAPGELSERYTDYLQEGGEGFAPGPHTSDWREQRAENAEKPGVRTEWADLPAEPPQYPSFALRTEDGGALAFFTTHHHKKQTVAKGYTPQVDDPYVKALLTGTPEKSVTYVRISGQAVTVPPRAGGDGGGGEATQTTFLSRNSGLTSAKGE
ncbi:hypothetical protein [Streptomyces sp. JJ36]|uniref:hypothetical protein n=1 Tax=Streptomyces sp. JJ36 TaxID=2736645 RepID=UPI001F357475|nr:hypothetical protein [Streptomyces sp. JJ36]MCF6521859.1 hypothetical protein [Streptomyces sp. JJ36]